MSVRNLPIFLAAILALAIQAFPASAATGEWVAADHIRLRLVANAPASDGSVEAAIEIMLDQGWKTYWRSPGDAGVPPRFDFAGSINAHDAAVDYPAPERVDDGYAASNVYYGHVVLPVRFTGAKPGKPVELDLAADVGVCEQVCVPISLQTSLTVPAGDADPDTGKLIAAARAALPGPGQPGKLAIASLKRIGGPDKAPLFEAKVALTDPHDAVLFVETPDDWYPAPAKLVGGDRFRFTVDRKTATHDFYDARMRLTLTMGHDAVERSFDLDATGSAP